MKTILTVASLAVLMAGCTSGGSTKESEVDDAAEQARLEAEAEAARQQALQDEEAAASESARAKCANADNVFYFDFDQSLLRSESRAALLVQAECLQKYGSSIRLEGHADERGTREYNMALGERRANAVRDFLVLNGVSSSEIETVSYGEERPAEVGTYDSAWSKNRRVELK